MPDLIVISLPRSGTTSVAEIFRNHGAINEYQEKEYVTFYSTYKNGLINQVQIDTYIQKRYLNDDLVIDAASFNFMVADRLKVLFPHTKFLLLRRELDSWANSFLKMLYYYSNKFKQEQVIMPDWMTEYGYVYSPNFDWQIVDDIYNQKMNPNVEHFLTDIAHTWHTFDRLKMDSTNKFLELQTRDLSNNIGKIAEFLGIDYDTSCIQTHFNKAKLGGNIINQNYIEILHSV